MSAPRATSFARAGALGVVAAGLAFAAPARATTCGRPELLDAVPPDGAKDVPPNASLFAHYSPETEYGAEDVVLTPPGGMDEAFAAGDPSQAVKWDGTEGLLAFTPPARLAPGDYTLVWPALRGLNTASPSLPATVRFTVGAVDDVAPPDFAGLTGVTWDLERQSNDCTSALENRLVFTLSLAPADDDGGRDGLTLVVFQSSGSGVDGGPVPVQTMAMPADGKPVVVKLSVGDATGHVCFAAIARDLTGKVSDSGSQTVCVDTTAPPFFRGCAIAAGGGGTGAGALAFVLFALTLARLRPRGA
ncbi:MAG TPA: hypothetical protein VHL80_05895 [Polyangia bacterium]|nr:hypothetical protein [Polyangia bacterium]